MGYITSPPQFVFNGHIYLCTGLSFLSSCITVGGAIEDVIRYWVILQVNHKESSVTFCQQVSSQQFEHQRVTGSQLALSELLEQILSDCKMAPKEKRKRLRMVSEVSSSLLELLVPIHFFLLFSCTHTYRL